MHRSKRRFNVYCQVLHQHQNQVFFLQRIFEIDVRRCDTQSFHAFVNYQIDKQLNGRT